MDKCAFEAPFIFMGNKSKRRAAWAFGESLPPFIINAARANARPLGYIKLHARCLRRGY